jgi:Matrixin
VLICEPAAAFADRSQPAGAWTSVFDSGPLHRSGWANCSADPIVLDVDASGVPESKRKAVFSAFRPAVLAWADQAGLAFVPGKLVRMAVDPVTLAVSPVGTERSERHILISLQPESEAAFPGTDVVGFAGPQRVLPATREITGAAGVFRVGYVVKASRAERIALYMHEIGHALGLGHSSSRDNVMFPTVQDRTRLGPGDIAGIRTITLPCAPRGRDGMTPDRPDRSRHSARPGP